MLPDKERSELMLLAGCLHDISELCKGIDDKRKVYEAYLMLVKILKVK